MTGYTLRFLLLFLLLAPTQPSPRLAAQQSAQRVPAGRAAANQATRQAEQVEPPALPPQQVTAADVLQQANELLSLAQQVHTDTQRATQGVVAKDLKDKLKRIEKLSKRLRGELSL